MQAKFKHAKHFDIDGNYNKQNADLFKQKIIAHVKNEETIAIAGTYRGEKVVHYFNEKTEVNVIKDLRGEYRSGWKLSENQKKDLKNKGDIR